MPRTQANFVNSTEGRNSTQAGFSLIEMIVALVLFLVVTGAIFGVMRVAQQGRSVVNEQVPLNKNARIALNLLGRDTYNVGFGYPLKSTVVLPDNRVSNLLGIPVDVDTSRDTIPPIISGNNITLNTFNTTAGVRTDQVTFLFKDTTFNLITGTGGILVSQPLNINAATTTGGIDEIIPISGTNANCRVNDIYLVSGNTGSTLGVATALSGSNKVQFSNGDLLGFNQTGSSGPLRGITTPASMQRVLMVTYFVTPDGTLTRREYANSTPAVSYTDDPLVFGVEDFQVEYVMDDGAISNNPSAGPDGIPGTADDTQANLAAIRQVRYTIRVRTTESSATGVFNRVNMSSTFSTRNLGYDAN